MIWAAPYRWGTMVIAYNNRELTKRKLAPLQVIIMLYIQFGQQSIILANIEWADVRCRTGRTYGDRNFLEKYQWLILLERLLVPC